MPSSEKDSHAIIHEHIIPRVEKIEKTQEELQQALGGLQNQMDMMVTQVKSMEISNQEMKLSNNDLKQTVVGYGQAHSMLLAKSMESQVEVIKNISTVFSEVKSAKEQTNQVKEKIETEKLVAKLSNREKIFVAMASSPGVLLGIEYLSNKF